MEYSEKNRSVFSSFTIVAIVSILLAVLFYVNSDYYKQRFGEGRTQFDYAGRPVQPLATTGQLILQKDRKIEIGRNCLVFKGMQKKTILVDLYLLDLDPEESFQKRFTKKEAKKEMLFGEDRYRLVSVNGNHLVIQKITSEK